MRRCGIVVLICWSTWAFSNVDQGDAFIAKAKSFLNHQNDSAFQYAKRALQLAQDQSNDSSSAQANTILAHIYVQYGIYNKAIEHYTQSIRYYERSRQPEKVAEMHNALGELYYLSLMPEYALTEHKVALNKYMALDDKKGIGICYGHLGHYFEKQGQYDSASYFQHKALKLFEEVGYDEGLSSIYGNLGSIYEDLERFDLAEDYFLKALEFNLLTGNQAEQIVHLNNLGDAYRKQGRLSEALQYTQQALQLAEQVNNKNEIHRALKDLAKTEEALGHYDVATQYLFRALDSKEEVYSEQSAQQLSGIQALNEMNEKENRIQLLEKDQELAKTNRNLLIAGIGLLLAVAFAYWLVQRNRMRQRSKLHETRERLTQTELEKAHLNEQNLEIEIENRRLQEQALQSELALKNQSLSTYALQVVQKNKQLKDLQLTLKRISERKSDDKDRQLRKLIKEIDQTFKQDRDWDDFKVFFEQVHPTFYPGLTSRVPDLSPAEIRLCTLLRLNMSTKDIAAILKVAPDSIRIARYRLRKKLPIDDGESLVKFMMDI